MYASWNLSASTRRSISLVSNDSSAAATRRCPTPPICTSPRIPSWPVGNIVTVSLRVNSPVCTIFSVTTPWVSVYQLSRISTSASQPWISTKERMSS